MTSMRYDVHSVINKETIDVLILTTDYIHYLFPLFKDM